MKIVLINTTEQTGGAAVACKRLFQALQKTPVEVKMLVGKKQSEEPDVIGLNTTFWKRKLSFFRFLWERGVIWLANGFSKKNLFAVSIANTGMDISSRPEVQEADIIHLHWINQGFLSLKDINKLVRLNKPIVWTMHDMWPCTGICHYARNCRNYENNCGNCFFLKHHGKKDLSHAVFEDKQKIDYGKIVFVTCSDWLKRQTLSSRLMEHSRIEHIPNPLNIKTFFPYPKKEIKRSLSLNEDKLLLLFGAANIADPRKGFKYYFDALQELSDAYPALRTRIELVFLGKSTLELPAAIPFRANFTGYLTDTQEIGRWYAAADLFIIPSLEENLPNTIMEAMACGTPAVGFDTGGIPEMIDHKENGYVANYKDSSDLMKGIYWCLFEANYDRLSRNAREKIINNYSEEIIASKYLALYHSLIKLSGSEASHA